jgi:XTP/dITP diphosphohydrolase
MPGLRRACVNDCKRESLRLAKEVRKLCECPFRIESVKKELPQRHYSMMTELLIATGNAGKVREVLPHLDGLPLRARSLAEFSGVTEVEETGSTFAENAALKATAYAAQTGLWTLADDSGLEVDALGGDPGIFSARYGGTGASDGERITRLLTELSRTGDSERRARFVCVIAIADPDARLLNTSTGICEGSIALAQRGEGGFGYDPVFIPDGYQASFGELSPEIKRRISHRARALQAARSFLLDHCLGQA